MVSVIFVLQYMHTNQDILKWQIWKRYNGVLKNYSMSEIPNIIFYILCFNLVRQMDTSIILRGNMLLNLLITLNNGNMYEASLSVWPLTCRLKHVYTGFTIWLMNDAMIKSGNSFCSLNLSKQWTEHERVYFFSLTVATCSILSTCDAINSQQPFT